MRRVELARARSWWNYARFLRLKMLEMKVKGETREDLPWSPFSGSSLAMVATVSGMIGNS